MPITIFLLKLAAVLFMLLCLVPWSFLGTALVWSLVVTFAVAAIEVVLMAAVVTYWVPKRPAD